MHIYHMYFQLKSLNNVVYNANLQNTDEETFSGKKFFLQNPN